jgi:effector-binding domain-containing protein
VLRQQHVRTGHNVVMYLDDLTHVEAGVEIFGELRPTGAVELSATPVGVAATTTHWGEYSAMAPAYAALERWIVTNKLARAGPSWEVYGDWAAEPEQRRTDIFLLLRAS